MRRRVLLFLVAVVLLVPGVNVTSAPKSAQAATPWTASSLAALVTASLSATTVPKTLNPSLRAALPVANTNAGLSRYVNEVTACDPIRHVEYARRPRPCFFGDTHATTTMAIFGGGSNLAWTVALDRPLSSAHIRIALFEFSGCMSPNLTASPTLFPQAWQNCNRWHAALPAAIAATHPSIVLTSSGAYESPDTDAAWVAAYADQIERIRVRVPTAKFVVMGSTPIFTTSVPNCVRDHQRSLGACTFLESTLIRDKKTFNGTNAQAFSAIVARDVDVATASGATLIPTEAWLCADGRCPAVIGNYLVYRDDRHFFTPFLTALGPVVDHALRDAGIY